MVLVFPKFNAAGLAALMMRAGETRKHIDALLSERPDSLAGATPEEIRLHARQILDTWPDDCVEVAFEVYTERHGGRLELVAEDGGGRVAFVGGTWAAGE